MKHILSLIVLLGLALSVQSQPIFNAPKADSLFQLLQENQRWMGAVSVQKNGEPVYQKAIGWADVENRVPITMQSRFRIGSQTKTFTAVMILQLVQENKLKMDDLLSQFFPEIPNAEQIKMAHLLRHRSGIYNFTNDPEYLSYHTNPITKHEILKKIAAYQPVFEPGSKAEYSNSNYILLGYILEAITGKDYADNLKARITEPLGLENTNYGGKIDPEASEAYSYKWEGGGFVPEAETNMQIPHGAGAVVSTVGDITLFLEALFNGGLLAEEQFAGMIRLEEDFGCGLFEMPFYSHEGMGHTGAIDGFSSMMAYYPEQHLAVSMLSNGSRFSNNEVMIALLSTYFGMAYELPEFTEVQVSKEVLQRYEGVYASPLLPIKLSIRELNGQLEGQGSGQPAFPLESKNDSTFTFDMAGIRILFHSDSLTLYQGGMTIPMAREKGE
ncbi:MAG: serine hydrolase [Bacteroidales bacterium]|jgi:CubicO group peptidase (beta-lactamase class C family)|nr:serine hydrolase [Bacteroidales bacterium]HOI33022.1 serine hydrolase domain-containing protein [Bacteroidales bacterium]